MEVGTCAKAESHYLRHSTFTCFASVVLSSPGLSHAHVLLRCGWKSSGCLSSTTGMCFGGACTTQLTAGNEVFVVCSQNTRISGWAHRSVSGTPYTYLQVLLHRLLPLQKREKLSEEAKLAKKSSLGLKTGHRLCPSLPQKNDFHVPFLSSRQVSDPGFSLYCYLEKYCPCIPLKAQC